MAFVLVVIGMIYCAGMVVLLLFRRTRKFAFWTSLLATLITLPLLVVAGVQLDDDPRKAGFRDADDKFRAQKAGISDAKLWNARRVEFLSKWSAEERQKDADARRAGAEARHDSDAACKADFNCWTNKFQRAATNLCAPQIEHLAKNNFNWIDSLSSPKFPRARISGPGTLITYVGDKIKMQNGFGAWKNVTYECDFDTEKGLVLAVRTNLGQLSN